MAHAHGGKRPGAGRQRNGPSKANAAVAKREKGSPSIYSEELGAKICEGLREGRTLRSICAAERMPSKTTVLTCAADPNHPFSDHYARAREVGYKQMADDLIDIADGKSVEWTEADAGGGDKPSDHDRDAVQRDRLRVDTRKWLLSKALPKVYGDKIVSELTGKDGGPIELAQIDPRDEIEDRIAGIAARLGTDEVPEGSK
jgi:hypothetical protein